MSFNKQTIRDAKLKGKTVLLRADYNVPIRGDGQIAGDYRLVQSIPTIQYLLKQGCKVVIISHMGRPKDKYDKHLSLKPVAKHLQKLLGQPVTFVDECIGPVAEKAVQQMKPKEVLMLENLRFHPEEEANDKHFSEALARLGDVFVQDGFGVVHRAHASTEGVTHYLPSVSGLLLEKEVVTLEAAISNPKRPLMAIVGGVKIADKIEFLERFIAIADFLVVGGAMANTFLLAKGVDVGSSIVVPEDVPLAKKIMEMARQKAAKQRFVFYLPQDGVVATSLDPKAKTRIVDWDTHMIADIENYPKRPPREASKIKSNELLYDIGPFSGAFIAGGMQLAETVIWNGAMGVTEVSPLGGLGPVGPFAHCTELIVESMLGQYGHRPFSIVGGGDTVSYVEGRGLTDSFNHVSTGGGASLELMSGKKLPGVEALKNKSRLKKAK
ncbi:MAG: phosphoglycerate kinase [Patescibacteria group bacterium]|nr:phosphoglycerate kinase [Patescibacteria group bacterium]